MDANLEIDLIIQLLPKSFIPFILNLNMKKIKCTLLDLLNMLTITQSQIKGKSRKGVLAIASSSRTSKKKMSSSNKKKKCRLKRDISKSKAKKKGSRGNCLYC